MRWEKQGLVFCPDRQFDWMSGYAAVPFARQLEGDLFKIYFSARDERNRSHTGFVVINLHEPQRVLEISRVPVLSPGGLGEFDEAGAMLSWITSDGGRQYLYYIGWNLAVGVPFRNSIGLAISTDDGGTFARFSDGPILDRSIYDPFFTANSCMLLEDGLWRMWYLSCVKWRLVGGTPQHQYHIKYAASPDGIHWQRDGRVCIDFQSEAEYAISRPSVLKDGDLYRMWYSCRGPSYRIGYAQSPDGLVWERRDAQVGLDVSARGWDSEMIEYPHVFDHKGTRYMLYNGNSYGKTGFGLAILKD